MTDTTTQAKIEADFQLVYSTIWTMGIGIECLQALQGFLHERPGKQARYALNKAKVAENACTDAHNSLMREMMRPMTTTERDLHVRAIEQFKTLTYDIHGLDERGQLRVRNLIAKIKKEQAL